MHDAFAMMLVMGMLLGPAVAALRTMEMERGDEAQS